MTKTATVNELYAALQAARRAEFRKCQNDYMYFICNYCFIEDKDHVPVLVKCEPWPEQLRAIESIHHHRRNIVLKGRQIGMTWFALFYSVWDLAFHSGHTVIGLSQNEDCAKELVRRVGVILSKMTSLLAGGNVTYKVMTEKVYIFENGIISVFKSFAATEGAGRSFTANIILIDEWAFQQYAAEIWEGALPTVSRPNGGKVIGLSTIKRGTFFEKKWVEENNFNKIFLSCFADPRRDDEWYRNTEKDLGKRMLQEFPRTAEEALANVGGLFFHEFDYSEHVCDPFPIPSHWEVYSAKDYGLDMLAHYKFAVDEDKNIYVIHEIAKSDLVVSEAARLIKDADRRDAGNGNMVPWCVPRYRLAPPDLFAVKADTGRSISHAFYEHGLRDIRVSNDRESGWLAVKELLRNKKLKIFRTCTYLIGCMQQILVDEKNPNDCEKQPHDLTHGPDALRYFAIWWVKPAEAQISEKRIKWNEHMYEDYRNAGPEGRQMMINKYGNPN